MQCLRTNDDGLCSVHSVFGIECNTRNPDETELYHNDAKAFIRESFGANYMTFSSKLHGENILVELEHMIWVTWSCLRVYMLQVVNYTR